MIDEISPFKALDFIRDNAPAYSQAKADVVYVTEYRKSLKAMLMSQSQAKTQSERESDAYAHEDYLCHLHAIRDAVAEAERLRWLMVAAEAKISVWQTLEATARLEMKAANI